MMMDYIIANDLKDGDIIFIGHEYKDQLEKGFHFVNRSVDYHFISNDGLYHVENGADFDWAIEQYKNRNENFKDVDYSRIKDDIIELIGTFDPDESESESESDSESDN